MGRGHQNNLLPLNEKRIVWLLSERYNCTIPQATELINQTYNRRLLNDHSLSLETIVKLIAENEDLKSKSKYMVFG